MNVSFGPETGSSPAPTVAEKNVTPVAAAPAAPQVPAVVNQNTALAPAGFILGDKLPTQKEIILPRLNIVQNIGDLKDAFSPGSLVYDKKVEIYTPPIIRNGKIEREGTPPVSLVVLGFYPTRYVEKIEGGGQGMIVDTEAAVRSNGGTLDYKEWEQNKKNGMRRFEYLAEAMIAIKRPESFENDGLVFTFEVGKEQYALGLWGLKGTAYTVAKRAFFTPRLIGCLKKGGYPSFNFAVTTKLEQKNGKEYWVPVCLPTDPTSETFLEFARSILSA